MKKVTIEVTEKGWETKVEINGETFIEKYERTNYGASSVERNFELNEEIDDDLYDAIDSADIYEIMRSLRE